MAGPLVSLDANGYPVYIEPIGADALRRIKPNTEAGLGELYSYLDIYGLDDANARRKFQQQYLSRFNITTDSPSYASALEQLATESASKRVVVAQARRAAQMTETIVALDGELQKTCVYVNDGPDPCDNCAALNGLEKKYTEFVNDGEVPGDRCLGGDNCLCILIPIN